MSDDKEHVDYLMRASCCSDPPSFPLIVIFSMTESCLAQLSLQPKGDISVNLRIRHLGAREKYPSTTTILDGAQGAKYLSGRYLQHVKPV